MAEDIERVKQETNNEKILTKHEWMVAALMLLDPEDPQLPQLYESLYIDPSKLTPYQQQQLE